jgi:hypothetical protein
MAPALVLWSAVLLVWSVATYGFRLGGEVESCGSSDSANYACLTVPAGTFNRAFSLYWTLEEGHWLRARAVASAAGAGSSGWLSLGEYIYFSSIATHERCCLIAASHIAACLICMQASARMDEWQAVQLSLHCLTLAWACTT